MNSDLVVLMPVALAAAALTSELKRQGCVGSRSMPLVVSAKENEDLWNALTFRCTAKVAAIEYNSGVRAILKI
jgi:hypothetical protein